MTIPAGGWFWEAVLRKHELKGFISHYSLKFLFIYLENVWVFVCGCDHCMLA